MMGRWSPSEACTNQPVVLGPIDAYKSTALNDTPDMYQEPYADGHLQDLPRETPLEGLKWMGWQLSNFVVGAF